MVRKIILIIRKTHLTVFFLLLLMVGGVFVHKPLGRLIFPFPFRDTIEMKAEFSGVDPQLIAALIYVESKFNPEAESRRGARGLMQVMPETALWVSEQKGLSLQADELYDPEVNLKIGIWYLAYLFREFNGDRVLVLAAYNAGWAKVKEWLASGAWQGKVNDLHRIPYQETRRYVAKIMRTYYL
ncbi:MAG TPA: lytic transglycosylase, partial [Firmicutes bacterium]|nr:lytic transglycosylase [Bacillota bacterium]